MYMVRRLMKYLDSYYNVIIPTVSMLRRILFINFEKNTDAGKEY